MSKSERLIVIVGAGPAGLGAALAFHNNNYKNIIVLESRNDLIFDEENSFPIGLNVRGQNAVKNLYENSKVELDFSKIGLRVDQWKVVVGPGINVANFDSGLSYGTSRAKVTDLLYEEVQRRGITVLFGHKSKSVDLSKKTITCELSSGEEKTFNPDALIVADGYKSKTRESIALQDSSLKIKQWPWNISFRVLFSEKNAQTDLNPHIHYIRNSNYTAKLVNGKWTCVIGIRENSPKFLLSDEPSAENVEQLKKFLKKNTPEVLDLFTDDEYRRYFNRITFTGSVTKVSKILIQDWALLLGDSAHSAIPNTGEGINSALEDAHILQNILKKEKSLTDTLIEYETDRLPDVNALSDIAYAAARSGFKDTFQTLMLKLFQKVNLIGPVKEEILFGKYSQETKRYREVVKIWQEQTAHIGGPNVPKDR